MGSTSPLSSIAQPRSYWQRLKAKQKSLFAILAMLARAFTLSVM